MNDKRTPVAEEKTFRIATSSSCACMHASGRKRDRAALRSNVQARRRKEKDLVLLKKSLLPHVKLSHGETEQSSVQTADARTVCLLAPTNSRHPEVKELFPPLQNIYDTQPMHQQKHTSKCVSLIHLQRDRSQM